MNQYERRIAGIDVEDDARAGAAWLMYDSLSDVVTLYDCCKYNREVWAVIAEGMNARGRWIPIAWNTKDKEYTAKLLDRGCNILYDGVIENQQLAEVTARDIQERMRTGRFKVDRRMAEWLQEFEVFSARDGKLPLSGFPLMSATRYAISQLSLAKRMQKQKSPNINKPRVAIV